MDKNVTPTENTESHEKFVPKGSIVFFILLMILFFIIWGGLYLIMISRA